MEPPPMETVYQAISALYDNPIASEKEKASLWLGDVQKSIHSWKIADELLQQKKDIHSCYFASQTMRSKIQHKLSELPSEALVSLRDSLVVHLEGTSPETSGAILTQLSLALADLALQMTTWQNIVPDLIKSFSNKNDYALLEILTVLPQEIDSPNLKLGENRRTEIKLELQANKHLVNMFLNESINNLQKTHISMKIIKCLTSWIQVRAISMRDVPHNAVIGYSLQVLKDFNSINLLHDVACDCVCAILQYFEENDTDEEIQKLLFDSVCGLEESYHLAVAHEEEDKAANYARLFTELAETFLSKIVYSASNGSSHFAMKSLELALICVGHHDYEVAEITFNLWYKLSDEVYQRDYLPLTEVFKPHIERLIEALARHCQFEPDHTQLPEEGDEFYDFRQKVMGLIKDVVFIVGSSTVFRQMCGALQPSTPWEVAEAALFVMQAVAKNILPEENEYVPKVVEAILSMPESSHLAVRRTCLLLLGELAEWLARRPPALPTCLSALSAALAHPALAPAAGLALQNITAWSGGQAARWGGALLQAWRRPLAPTAAHPLARALAHALSALPPPQLTEAMREAVSVQLVILKEILESNKEVRKGTPSDPTPALDKLAALFRDVKVEAGTAPDAHPCLPALADCWPVVRDVMNKCVEDGRVMERSCRLLRFCVRCVGAGGAGLAGPLGQVLARLYARAAHSCVLYLASVLLDELASSAAAVPDLVALLQALLPPAFQLLQMPDGLRENPDTVDDLFRLCIRFVQRLPWEVLSCGAAAAAAECARAAAGLDHRDASASVMRFLAELARLPASRTPPHVAEAANALIQSHGEKLTCALIEASVVHLHSYMLSDVADALLPLLAAGGTASAGWLRAAVAGLPPGPPAATAAQIEAFHTATLRAEKNKEMTKLLREFVKLYR